MSDLRIGLVQMQVQDGQPQANLDRALKLLSNAPAADVYLLPELWTTGYAHDGWHQAARDATPAIRDRLLEECRARHCWIGSGQISINAAGQLANRFWLLGPDGETESYDKGHLFAPMGEPERLAAGDSRVAISIGDFRVALSICFDLRFPEMYRLDALDGADLFLVISEWPAERAEALRILARARALENQCHVALCNRVGVAADGTAFGGGSMIVAPDGSIVVDAGGAECVVTGTVKAGARLASGVRSLLTARRPGLDWADTVSVS